LVDKHQLEIHTKESFIIFKLNEGIKLFQK